KLFAIAIRGGRRGPDFVQIGTERANFIFFFLAECARALLFPPQQFRLGSSEIAQAFFPFCFQPAGHESVFGLDRTILTLRTFCLVASTFHRQTPLTQCCILVSFELLYGELRCFQSRGRQGFEKGVNYRLIDLDAADVETVHAASLDDILAGAMIAGRRASAAIVSVQPAATLSTRGQALQQCSAFSHRTSCLVWLRMNVGVDAGLVGLERRPIDEPGMMFRKQHGPLGHRQMTSSSSERSLVIGIAFMTRLSVGVSASIHRIREHVMDGGVSRDEPTDLAFHVGSQGERKTLGAEPKPDLADRSKFREFREDGTNGADNGFVGMKTNFTVLFSPNEANG